MLALYLLLQRPGLFRRFIATSPAVVDQGVAQLDPNHWPAPASVLPSRLFVSVGSADDDYRPHIESFLSEARGRNYAGLRFDSAVLPDLNHISLPRRWASSPASPPSTRFLLRRRQWEERHVR